MASRSRNVIAAALVQKGFWQHDTHRHRHIYVTEAGERTHITTKGIHTRKMKQIDADLFSEMARQCRLTTSQFVDLVDCPMSRKDYEDAGLVYWTMGAPLSETTIVNCVIEMVVPEAF